MNYTEEFNRAYEDLQKAIRNRSYLVPKVITDKNGHQRKVMVKPEEIENKKTINTKSGDFVVGSIVTLKNDAKNRRYKIVSINKDGTYHLLREDGAKFHGTKKDIAKVKNKSKKTPVFNPTEIIESGKLPDGLSEQKLRIIQKQAKQMRKYDIEQAAQDKLDEIKSEKYKKKMEGKEEKNAGPSLDRRIGHNSRGTYHYPR